MRDFNSPPEQWLGEDSRQVEGYSELESNETDWG